MDNILQGLEPEPLWRHFFQISRIPRCPGNEAGVRDYVLRLAGEHGFPFRTDRMGNTVVEKAARPGRESGPRVVLQSHLDMVCEKNRDTVHDFARDPLRLTRKGEWIRAEGTSLGADNGVGVAAMLAVMESRDIPHGPLELLFTVDEERGLTGAFGLGRDLLRGRILLNLDSEEEGAIYIGCAGGLFTELDLNLDTEPLPKGCRMVGVRVGGLHGGHSGVDIHEGRANAIKLLTRLLCSLSSVLSIRLAGIHGGDKLNAIPRECDAWVSLPEEGFPGLKKAVANFERAVRQEYGKTDPEVFARIDEQGPSTPDHIFRKTDQERLLELLHGLPHGVIAMSRKVPGTVETSSNLAVVKSDARKIHIGTMQRSSLKQGVAEASERVASAGKKAGAEVRRSGEYPSWAPDPQSSLLQAARKIYLALYNSDPHVKATHAGLECGIIGDKFPGMDMISFGPTIQAPHSPKERLEIRSVRRFWKFLEALLREIS